MSLMDSIVAELGNNMKDAEYEEKTAQKDYAELMSDCQASRAQDAKSVTDKETFKAELEMKLINTKEARSNTAQDLKLTGTYIEDLHVSCDFIMQNFNLRKEARSNEIESLRT